MVTRLNPPSEYATFMELEHWQPLHKIISPDAFFDPKDPWYPFFSALYVKTQKLYQKVPMRKNGENPFVHPLNVVRNLRKAGVIEGITLCAGLLHDVIEEEVDIHKRERKILKTKEGRALLDRYEEKVFTRFEKEVLHLCAHAHVQANGCHQIIETLHLLTKHKRHFYYKYISTIFNCPDAVRKEMALQVKLADRMHNILSVDCFNGEEKIYQCFKNLFILNNTKKFLLDSDQKGIKNHAATRKLFKKCSKATYDAFLEICKFASPKEIAEVQAMVELAFHKFAIEKEGLCKVTDVKEQEMHPMRLFQGVVRKYDARLHHEYELFETLKKQEREYCRKFFTNYKFTPLQLQALIDYKDAYALKEVMARLLYDPSYVISGFLVQELSREGRIRKQ